MEATTILTRRAAQKASICPSISCLPIQHEFLYWKIRVQRNAPRWIKTLTKLRFITPAGA